MTTAKILIASSLLLALTACKSAEERAEESYQSAIALFETGDVARAVVELRNVFQLNGQHRDARWMLAQIQLNEQDNKRAAYSQLLRLAEQYPEDAEVRILLSQLAFNARNFDEFERHGTAANELAPERTDVASISLGLEYREAALANENAAINELGSRANILLQQSPEDSILRAIVIDVAIRNDDLPKALGNIDELLKDNQTNRSIQDQRLSLVAQLGDRDEVEAQLLTMVELFDEDTELKATTLRFYLSNGETENAEGFLRDISSPSDEDPGPFVDLIRFVAQTKGQDAAMVEIERAIAENPDPDPFRALRASFWFADGEEAKAIAELEDIIANSETSDQLEGIKITLAQMLVSQGNEVGARSLIEETISTNPLSAEALKIRAVWHIEADEIDLAISDLRTALDSEPDDSEAMTLMSQAYSRLGSHDLSREFLALATDASNNSPEESLRYAARLFEEGDYLSAEGIIISSLRLNPGNIALLEQLGRTYLALEDEPRARQVVDTLRNDGSEQANVIANAIEAEVVNQNAGAEEALAFLEDIANSETGNISAQLSLLRGRIATGDLDGARSLLATLQESDPENLALLSVGATIEAIDGNFDAAEAGYRAVLAKDSQISRNWLELVRLLNFQGKSDEGRAALADGLAAMPEDPGLLWAQASILEQDGRIDEAIGIYERLYESTSGAPVVANNLASLIATYRDDDESLERAFILARRLQGTEVPQFQDTIGWILHRRGEHAEALPYLEEAAAALTNDAMTQFHLGMVQSALGQRETAIEQLQKAVDIAGPEDTRVQFMTAREEIVKLQSQ